MKCNRFLFLVCVVLWVGRVALAEWRSDGCFGLGETAGRPCLVAPDGKPFKSVGMVWAYGPERGPFAGPLTTNRLYAHLQMIKDLGFNTLNLYGDQLVPEMLDWCDRNELAVYFRTSYYSLPGFPGDLKEYPDYMDPSFRRMAKESYKKFIGQIRGHPSVLAVDMDHRWLFPLDWVGARRFDQPMIRAQGIAYFPRWLGRKYGRVERLNSAWGTKYASFDSVLKDPALFKDGVFAKLGDHPARVDVYLYTLWTAADFLSELSRFFQGELPGIMITPTTEHPECIPETNPDRTRGIPFMSPVHYNAEADFDRDLPSLCKLIYETRWHYDMQGGPVYISETGFRTDALEQKPPVKSYAWLKPETEETAARAYAEQFTVLNLLPWIGGYGYFKLYDKVPEGDFGYVRDDGSKKPMALIGDAINHAFDSNAIRDPEPEIWIYYPEYAQASRRPGFEQIKTLVAIWQKPFFDALKSRLDRYWKSLSEGDRKAGRKFAEAVTRDFEKLWKGFAFTKIVPTDDKPMVLLSTISEILSAEDRAALMAKKTIAFGPVGVRDVAMRGTAPWSLQSVGIRPAAVRERAFRLSLGDSTLTPVSVPADAPATNPAVLYLPAGQYEPGVPCSGQGLSVPPGRYTRLELLLAAEGGNAAPFFDLAYADGTWSRQAFAPTVSDARYAPMMTPSVTLGDTYLSVVAVALEAARPLVRVELPDAPWVRVYGVVLVQGGVAEDVRVGVEIAGKPMRGSTPWWLALPEDTAQNLRVLERFETGEAAVVADGPHVVFLYDPLTWAGKADEISRQTDLLKESMDGVLKYLQGVKTDD